MNKIRKGDEVVVLAGGNSQKGRPGKGARGTVLSVLGDRVLVEGINRVKCHVKPNPMKGVVGGVVEKELPIHISNVALFNPLTQKADKVGFVEIQLENGAKKKVRVFKSNGEQVGV